MSKNMTKKYGIMLAMSALPLTVGLIIGFAHDKASEIYNAGILRETGLLESTPDDFYDTETDDHDVTEPDVTEPDAPQELEPVPEADSHEQAEPEESDEIPPVEENGIDMQGNQADIISSEEQPEESEPQFESEMPPTAETEAELESEIESESETESTAETEDESESEIESEAETEAESEAESELEPEPSVSLLEAGFTVLSSNEAVVKTYQELKDALADDNGITTVYLGNHISMQDGIKINPKKAAIIIDGLNPLETSQLHPYTLADLNSASFYDTIYVDEAGTESIHVRDLTITGRNYYGPVSILDAATLAGITITFERVDYNGPQMCYHRRGTVRLIDCTAKINGGNGTLSPNQEFSEVKHLVFEGKNSIETATSAYSVFWHPLGGTFTLPEDASLALVSPDTSTAFGIFFADSYLYSVDISIGSRAVFDATISGVLAPELYVTLKNLTVHEGGAFHLNTTKTATATVMRMGGPLVIEKDAHFVISGYGGSAYTVLRQAGGDITVGKDAVFRITAESPYTSLLNLAGRAFFCDDPLSVLLLNGSRDIQASTAAGRVYVNAEQVNYRNTVSVGGLDNPPLYKWTKADRTNVEIDGTLSYFGATDFTSLTSNHLATDPPYVSPNTTNFSMVNARTLAFGRLELIVAEPTTHSGYISGVTQAGATVRASFTQGGADYTLPDVITDSEGMFHIPVGTNLQGGTVVTVKSAWQYLSAETQVTVNGDGQLLLFVPDILEFHTTQLSQDTKTVQRVNPAWRIVVSDTRGGNGNWILYARLDNPISPSVPDFPALKNALVFVDNDQRAHTMYPGTDVLIQKHAEIPDEDVYPVVWDNDKGMLLTVKPGAAFADTVYTADIAWTIVDGV